MDSKGKIIAFVVALLVIAGVVLGCVDGFGSQTVSLFADNIEMVYGDNPNISDFKIEECSSIFKRKTSVSPTLDMVDYDPEYIGMQEAVFSYKEKSISFNLTIKSKQLNSPVISCRDGIVDWSDDSHASKYVVNINGTDYDSMTSEYDLNIFSSITGEINIKVKSIALNNKYENSNYSNTLSFNKLDAVSNVIYENGKIKWSSVSNANKYFVWINGIKYDSPLNELEYSNFVVGSNEIKIQAYGSDSYISSNIFTDSLTKYSMVSNIRYESGMIVWDSTNINCSYEISINGNISSSESKYFEIALDHNVSYSVKVRAKSKDSKHIDSEFSDINEIVYRKLLEPTITISTGDYVNTYNVAISAVENANEYNVEVKLYTIEGIYSTNTYVLTNNLTKEISVTLSIVKIEVSVVAKDTNGVFDQSSVVTKSRDI